MLGENEKMIREKFCEIFVNFFKEPTSKLEKGYSKDLVKQTVGLINLRLSSILFT